MIKNSIFTLLVWYLYLVLYANILLIPIGEKKRKTSKKLVFKVKIDEKEVVAWFDKDTTLNIIIITSS